MVRALKFCSYYFALILLLSCHNKSDKIKYAIIKFDKINFDFGKYKWERGVEKKVFFKYRNIGNNPLIITDIETSCGCTIPKWNKKVVPPNKSDSIEVIYDSRKLGFFNKTITIVYNGENPIQQLTIKGEIVYPGTNKSSN